MTAPARDIIRSTVIANRLEAITREMGAAMLRSARSPVFAENRDFVTALFDSAGRMVAQTAYIPVLLGSTPFAVQAVIEYFGDEVAEGDVMVLNDPFWGNNHLPDATVFRPVFFDGTLRFWAVTRGHHADTGGASAGGYNPTARTVWEEGLRITPSKLYRRGEYNRELWDLILTNVRLSSLVEGDLHCQVGATHIGERSLFQLLERYGWPVVDEAIEDTLSRSRDQVRAALGRMPDGEYRARRQVDLVEERTGEPVAVELTLRIAGERVTFDFTGSSPQTETFHNSSFANTVASCLIALFSTIDPDIKLNWGSMESVEVVAPPGTVVHAADNAATTMCTTVLCSVIVEVGWLALAEAVPELGQALWSRRGIAGMSSGINERTGMPFAVLHNFSKGGSGACLGYDGWDHLSPVSSTGARAPDPELFELRSPHRILKCEYRVDSAGAGQWRGGHGGHYRVLFTSDTSALILEPSCVDEATAPAGIAGGDGSPTARAFITRANGEVFTVERSMLYRPRQGDTLDVLSTGGGGYGDPRRREAAAVLRDIRAGLLSHERARAVYGVEIDPDAAEIRDESTRDVHG